MAPAKAAVQASGRPGDLTSASIVHLNTPEEASERIGSKIITPSWIREKARKREIDFILIAGKVALTEAHLIALIEQHEVKSGDGAQGPAASRQRRATRRGDTEHGARSAMPLRARQPKRRSA